MGWSSWYSLLLENSQTLSNKTRKDRRRNKACRLRFEELEAREVPAAISLTTLGTAYTQNFDTLSNTAGSTTNNLTINGWQLTESGGGARDNEQYGVDTGGSTTGDMYSYGAAGNTERALGGLQSGTLIPVFGAEFVNNSGATITSLDIAYTGEQWRIGNTAAARDDRIDFQISTDATSLVVGTYVDANALDFTNPIKTAATVGALDGNSAANRTAITSSIMSLSIPNGATFWIRWNDLNASGADDGLSIDDFSLTPQGAAAQPPVANDDTGAALTEDGADGTVNVLTNDTDPDGNPTAPVNGGGQFVVDLDTGTAGVQPTFTDAQGVWSLDTTTGIVTFNPANNYNGTAVITYSLTDPTGLPDTATITFVVGPAADAPVANDDTGAALTEDGADGTVNVLTNDTDPDGNPTAPVNGGGQFVVDLDTGTAGVQTTFTDAQGVWTLDTATGIVTFNPANNYNGTAVITYSLTDPTALSDTATITFVVGPAADAPVANDDTGAALTENGADGTVNVLTNDTDPDGNPTAPVNGGGQFVVDLDTGTAGVQDTFTDAQGVWTLDTATGIVTFNPANNYNGTAVITYSLTDPTALSDTATITFVVNPVADPPVANDDTGATLTEDGADGTVNVLTNDTDPDGNPTAPINGGGQFSVDLDTGTAGVQPTFTDAQGVWTLDIATGVVTFNPANNYNGTAVITYSLTDPTALSDTATITFVVNPAADAPVANDDTGAALTEDGADGTVNVLTNDTDPDGNPTAPVNGGGQFVVDLDTVTAGVQPTFTDTQGVWTLDTATGIVTFNPANNFSGTAVITYSLTDPTGLSDTATITFPVTAVNDVPVALASSVTTDLNTPFTFAVSDFLFSDAESNGLVSITVSGLTLATGDTLTVNQGAGAVPVTNGMTITAAQISTLIYTPATGAVGSPRSTFMFTVNDAGLGTVAATMSINVVSEARITNVTSTTANGYYNAGDQIVITVTFNEIVTVTGTPQLTLETGATDAVVNYTSGSGTNTLTFTYTVAPGQNSADLDYVGTASLTLNGGTIKDALTANAILTLPIPGATGSLGNNKAIVIDTNAPTVSISAPSASVTATNSVTYTITYSDANFDASTLTAANITLNATGTATGTISVSGTGTTRTVTISNITGNGTLGISLLAGTAIDLAGNLAPAVGPSSAFTVDNSGPTVTISNPSASITNGAAVTYTVTYTDANFASSTLSIANITLNATGSATGTVSVSGTGNTRTVTISNITGSGTLGISIAAGTASDTLGNLALAAGPSAQFAVRPPSISAVGGANGVVRVVSNATGAVLSTFRPLDFSPDGTPYTGLVQVALGDLNGDGVTDVFVAAANPLGVDGLDFTKAGKVFVYDGSSLVPGATPTVIHTFTPFATSRGPTGFPGAYINGLNIATGDIDGDGKVDLIAGTRGGSDTAGKIEYGRLVVVNAGDRADGLADTIIGQIISPFGVEYQKGIVVAAGNLDGVVGDEIAVTRGGPVADSNPNKSIKLKAFKFSGSVLRELDLNGATPGAFAPFPSIVRDGRLAFVDADGNGKDELVFSALDPASSQVRIAAYTVNTATGLATPVSPGGSYLTGTNVVDHAIARSDRDSNGFEELTLLTQSANSGIQFLNPMTGAILPGGFSLTLINGGVTIDGI